jgi:hypothetical protein
MKSNRLTGSVLLKVLVACALIAALVAVVIPAMAAPKFKTVEAGETWVVEETTKLNRLTIEEGGSITARAGYEVIMTVQNVETAIEPGTYKGNVVLTVTIKAEYACLNPKGEFIPVEIYPLAPRLDTFDGKTVLLYASEANPVIFPILGPLMEETYPNTTFEYIWTERYGESTPTEEQLAKYDAVIRGISW